MIANLFLIAALVVVYFLLKDSCKWADKNKEATIGILVLVFFLMPSTGSKLETKKNLKATITEMSVEIKEIRAQLDEIKEIQAAHMVHDYLLWEHVDKKIGDVNKRAHRQYGKSIGCDRGADKVATAKKGEAKPGCKYSKTKRGENGELTLEQRKEIMQKFKEFKAQQK